MPELFKDGNAKKKADEDEKMKELHSKWTREQEFLLAEWAEKASCYRWLHGRAEKKYRKANYSFTIPVIIMSTLTGTANFAMDSFVPEEHKKTAMAAVGGVNIFAGIISTLQNFLRYAELMESHRASGISWSKLNRDICIELALDPPRRKPARDFLNICRAEYDRLIEQSPMIDDSIITQFHRKFPNIEINKPEMCNGLDKCEIYQPTKEEKAAEILANVTTKMANTKKRMFTIDKPPAPPQEPVKHTHGHHESKHELAGLAGLGKVSSLKHLQVKPKKPIGLSKKDVQKELKSVIDDSLEDIIEDSKDSIIEEVTELLPKTPRTIDIDIPDDKDDKDDTGESITDDKSGDDTNKQTQTDVEMGVKQEDIIDLSSKKESTEPSQEDDDKDFLQGIVDEK
jgi:hypothetical protein